MTPHFALCLGLALVIVGYLVVRWFALDVYGEWQARKAERIVREAADTARVKAALAELRTMPEAEWERRFDERARLRSVRVPGSLRVVPEPVNEDDAFWADLVRPDAWCAPRVPQQRSGGAS